MASPKKYHATFIEPGVVSYEDVNEGKILVRGDALERMAKTFVGMPVINFGHRTISPEEAFDLSSEDRDNLADGVVSAVEPGTDGWWVAHMMIWDEETQANIRDGYSVSCAYIVEQTGPGGTWHGIDYNAEITDGRYTHMAIVENPRYEGATIYENSKNKKEKKMGFFKKTEVDIDLENAFAEIDGVSVPVTELVNSYKLENEKKDEKEMVNEDDEVEVDGKKVKVSELIKSYKKANENAVQDEVAEEVVEEQNETVNAELKNASKAPGQEAPRIMTRAQRIEEARKAYGKRG